MDEDPHIRIRLADGALAFESTDTLELLEGGSSVESFVTTFPVGRTPCINNVTNKYFQQELIQTESMFYK